MDTEWHAAIFRRLNEDVTLDEFTAAFQSDPHSTRPMTFFVGGPDLPGGESLKGYCDLEAGTYVVVDNWVEPWRFTTFTVDGQKQDAKQPDSEIGVAMKEYAFEMPKFPFSSKTFSR